MQPGRCLLCKESSAECKALDPKGDALAAFMHKSSWLCNTGLTVETTCSKGYVDTTFDSGDSD